LSVPRNLILFHHSFIAVSAFFNSSNRWQAKIIWLEGLLLPARIERFKMECGIRQNTRAHSLAWLERPADNREVKSPNLFGPTISIWLIHQNAFLRAFHISLVLGIDLHPFRPVGRVEYPHSIR
jgi:hypothetical protein